MLTGNLFAVLVRVMIGHNKTIQLISAGRMYPVLSGGENITVESEFAKPPAMCQNYTLRVLPSALAVIVGLCLKIRKINRGALYNIARRSSRMNHSRELHCLSPLYRTLLAMLDVTMLNSQAK